MTSCYRPAVVSVQARISLIGSVFHDVFGQNSAWLSLSLSMQFMLSTAEFQDNLLVCLNHEHMVVDSKSSSILAIECFWIRYFRCKSIQFSSKFNKFSTKCQFDKFIWWKFDKTLGSIKSNIPLKNIFNKVVFDQMS